MASISPLKIFGTGQITLPKAWREKYKAEYFIAEETPHGLLIKPLVNSVYYEINDENFGIHFPTGMPAPQLAAELKKANGKLHQVS